MTRPVRVLFVIGTMDGGGAERQVLLALRHLDRTRFTPLLYLASRTGELLDQVPADVPVFASDDPDTSPLRTILKRIGMGPLSRAWHLSRILCVQRIDCVYDRTFRATLDASLATQLRPTPRVSCCVVDPQPELELHSRRFRRVVWSLARQAYQTARTVLTNSDALRNRLISYFRLQPDHVAVCPNLLDIPELDRRADSPIDHPVDSPFLIVAAGRLHPQKGFLDLLQAAGDLIQVRDRKLHLVILGDGPQREELQDWVRVHQLGDSIELRGIVDNVPAWFRAARLFVLPSRYEGLPNALLEAVACGTPAIATDCPCGPAEILEHGRWGALVPPADPAALAAAIESAMDDCSAWQQRATIAAAAIRQTYDAASGIRKLESFLSKCCR